MIEEYQQPRLHPEMVSTVHELHGTLCAAVVSLRSMAGVLETSIDKKSEYSHEDLTADIHCIRSALKSLEVIIRARGLQCDPINYRV